MLYWLSLAVEGREALELWGGKSQAFCLKHYISYMIYLFLCRSVCEQEFVKPFKIFPDLKISNSRMMPRRRKTYMHYQ